MVESGEGEPEFFRFLIFSFALKDFLIQLRQNSTLSNIIILLLLLPWCLAIISSPEISPLRYTLLNLQGPPPQLYQLSTYGL